MSAAMTPTAATASEINKLTLRVQSLAARIRILGGAAEWMLGDEQPAFDEPFNKTYAGQVGGADVILEMIGELARSIDEAGEKLETLSLGLFRSASATGSAVRL